MHIRSALVFISVLVPVSVSLAGEAIPLDKDFSFRLDNTNPASPSAAPCPEETPPAEREQPDAMKTPQGERLPPGAREHKFNGQSYYFIPLSA